MRICAVVDQHEVRIVAQDHFVVRFPESTHGLIGVPQGGRLGRVVTIVGHCHQLVPEAQREHHLGEARSTGHDALRRRVQYDLPPCRVSKVRGLS